MKLEDQVVSLELAKKLKEAGVKQESVFVWMKTHDREMGTSLPFLVYKTAVGWYMPNGGGVGSPTIERAKQYAAFTVAELGEMLPREIKYQASSEKKSGFNGYRSLNLTVGKTIIDAGWYVMYSDSHPANKVPVHAQHADTEANARGKMLLYLLENQLITL